MSQRYTNWSNDPILNPTQNNVDKNCYLKSWANYDPYFQISMLNNKYLSWFVNTNVDVYHKRYARWLIYQVIYWLIYIYTDWYTDGCTDSCVYWVNDKLISQSSSLSCLMGVFSIDIEDLWFSSEWLTCPAELTKDKGLSGHINSPLKHVTISHQRSPRRPIWQLTLIIS